MWYRDSFLFQSCEKSAYLVTVQSVVYHSLVVLCIDLSLKSSRKNPYDIMSQILSIVRVMKTAILFTRLFR